MRRVALLFAAVLSTVRPSTADACTCGRVPMERTTVPSSGTRGFPTDGRIRVFLTGGFPAALRARMAQQYRLRGPDGKIVPMDGKVEDLMLSLRPRAPLAPRAQYVLERVHAYTPGGDLLSDSQRWERVLYSPGELMDLYWYPDSWFVTGDGPEERTPIAPELIEARAQVNGFGSSCGPGAELTVSFKPAAGMGPSDVLGLERKGGGILRTFSVRQLQPAADGSMSFLVGDTICEPDPLSPGVDRDSEVRLVAISPDDDQAPAPHYQPVTGKLEAEQPVDRNGKKILVLGTIGVRQPEEGEAAALERWFQGRPREARAAAPGPAACPFGLERIGTVEDPPARSDAHAIAITGPRSDGVRMVAPLPAARGRKEPRTREVWVRELSFEGKTLSNPLLAAGPRHTLACWNERAAQQPARLMCAILDSATGRVEKAPTPLELPGSVLAVPALRNGAAIALPTSFMIGWTGSAGPTGEIAVHLTLLAESGEPPVSDRVFSGTGDIDLARAGMRVAIARESAAGLELDVIDATAADSSAARHAVIGSSSTGRPRHPRVTLRGELAVLVWQNESDERLFVTVADSSGQVAQPLPLGHGKLEAMRAESKSGALGVTASWGSSEQPLEGARLQCRRRAAFTAPWRLDTTAEGAHRPAASRSRADGNRSPSGAEMLDSPR